jgi:TorA maturation chaperone TorD
MNDNVTLQELAQARAKSYRVLSALYLSPPAEALAAEIRRDSLVVEDASHALRGAARELSAAFCEFDPPAAERLLAAEHTRLFVLPSGVLPHEAVFLDENRRLGGRVTESVRRFYREAGAEASEQCLELPDHVGVELEFMAFLCGIEAQLRQQADAAGLRRCVELQERFLAAHLGRWHTPFCEKLAAESRSDVYRALARLTLAFLDVELARVPALNESLQSEARTVCVPVT